MVSVTKTPTSLGMAEVSEQKYARAKADRGGRVAGQWGWGGPGRFLFMPQVAEELAPALTVHIEVHLH